MEPTRFTVFARISPPGNFGLPDGDRVVRPAIPESISSPPMTRRGVVIGRGSVSTYRLEPLMLSVDADDLELRLEDDYLTATLTSGTEHEAVGTVRAFLEDFVRLGSVHSGTRLKYELILVQRTDDDDDDGRVPEERIHVTIMNVTTYNLDEFAKRLSAAALDVRLVDDVLDRSLSYFDHSMWLFDLRTASTRYGDNNFRQLISSAFLNVWKSVAVIVGDPSTDKDYQSRYRRFGITNEYFKTKIEMVRRLRNDYDVAHYALGNESLQTVEENFSLATTAARDVIQHYLQSRRASSSN